jgi:hypothetical protein
LLSGNTEVEASDGKEWVLSEGKKVFVGPIILFQQKESHERLWGKAAKPTDSGGYRRNVNGCNSNQMLKFAHKQSKPHCAISGS